MSIPQIIFSAEHMLAIVIYGIAIIIVLPLSDRIHASLEHSILQWNWDHVAMPLIQVLLIILFIVIAYPVVFGINAAPSIGAVLSDGEIRMNILVNLLFVLTLLFPLIPIIGNWNELILPLQGIAASMMIFSWLASEVGIERISYWPGFLNILMIIFVAFITHKLGHPDRGPYWPPF